MDRNTEGLRPEDLIGDPENPNSPMQMLEALVQKAIDTGSVRPLGQAMGGFQAQMDAVFGMFQHNMNRFGHVVSVHSMQMDTLRMAFIALSDLLVEKSILTREEMDKLHENVQKKMQERVEAARKAQEDAMVTEQAGISAEEVAQEEAEEKCACCDKASDVVLASERVGESVKFPDKTE